MNLKELFYLHKSDRQVILGLLSVAVVALGGMMLLEYFDEKNLVVDEELQDDSTLVRNFEGGDIMTLNGKKYYMKQGNDGADGYYNVPQRKTERFFFDPNTADSTDFLRLGLKSWQIRNIYKYRAAGGVYSRKEDFAKLYGLTVKEYRELEPYIRISADYKMASTLLKEEVRQERDTVMFPYKIAAGETVDVNKADTNQLKRVPGIGSYYAREIVRYRQRLGGYANVNQLDEIDGFPEESKRFLVAEAKGTKKMNLNRVSLVDLKRHPYFNYYQARAIVDYRRLYGPLKSLDDLRLLNDFSPEVIKRLSPYVEF